MWDLPRPGLEPVSPALAGGFLTTAPPGKSKGRKILAKLSGQGNTLKSTETFEPLFSGYEYLPFDWLYKQNVCFLRTWLFSECLSGDSPAQISLELPTSPVPYPALLPSDPQSLAKRNNLLFPRQNHYVPACSFLLCPAGQIPLTLQLKL